ncbi:MAG: hypothetical protein IIT70_05485 [Clostridia bacterium]|nr:hypothetical protein [Clostridia bacterium]MBQ5488286.1 hypothetical protein [Clostridia bacterium]
MLDRKTRALQKQIKAQGDELLCIQEDIGALLAVPVEPGDYGVIFRCRLLINRCKSLDEKLGELQEELPLTRETAISHSLILHDKQILEMQKNTVTSLLNCIKRSNATMLEANRAALLAEAAIIGERIKRNGK